MASSLRKWLKAIHPEGIPGPCAFVYDALTRSSIFQRHYDLVAQDILNCGSQGRLLDIGTGPAWLLLKLHQRAPQLALTGLDISPAMVRKAKANIAQAHLTGAIELVEAGAKDLPFPDCTFDLVVSTGSIHHWKDPVRSLDECHRVLKAGGTALIYDLVVNLPEAVRSAARREFGRYRMLLLWLHSFEEPFYSQQQMADLAAQSVFGKGDVRFVGVLCCLTLHRSS
ncbi:MAG: class I SAM-dependent methyltransferase [Phycisphaerae bacterium]|nr:class I SAM-dependent methyltransferase [Phycisphaerae bacterium]